MKMIRKLLKTCVITLILTIGFYSGTVSASTQYADKGITNTVVPHLLRNKIVTVKQGSTSKYSGWTEKGSFNNKYSRKKATFTYSYTAENSRTFSLGANVTKKVLGHEVNITIGSQLSWKHSDTLSGSVSVSPRKKAYAYIRYKTTTVKYKHTVTKQWTNGSGRWENRSKSKVSYSYVTTKTPEITIKQKNK